MKYAIPEKAVKMLRRVKRHILAEPRRFDMKDWVKPSRQSPCGTVGCIAGWALLLNGPKQRIAEVAAAKNQFDACDIVAETHVQADAAKVLGLSDDKAERLFFVKNPFGGEGWPKEFRVAHNRRKTTKAERARIVAQRIEHFIKTGE